jgi:hypothetical protein
MRKKTMMIFAVIFLIVATSCSIEADETMNIKKIDSVPVNTIYELGAESSNDIERNEETLYLSNPISVQYYFESHFFDLNNAAGMAIAKFLRDYLSLYSLGEVNCAYMGTYFSIHEWDYINDHALILTERPLVVHKWISDEMPRSFFYSRNGERFEDVVFLYWPGWVAVSFSLFNIDCNDYPVIAIHWNVLDTSSNSSELFRFKDGEFQSIGFLYGIWWQFFHDYEGRLVVLFDSDMYEHYEYAFIVFTDEGFLFEEILTIRRSGMECEDFSEWYTHHRTESFTNSPTIFRTNQPLTPIHPQTDLRYEILFYLRNSST